MMEGSMTLRSSLRFKHVLSAALGGGGLALVPFALAPSELPTTTYKHVTGGSKHLIEKTVSFGGKPAFAIQEGTATSGDAFEQLAGESRMQFNRFSPPCVLTAKGSADGVDVRLVTQGKPPAAV